MAKDGNRQKFSKLDGKSADMLIEDELNGSTKGDDGEGDEGEDPVPEAKYTDAEVDEIVKKKLARERSKMERQIREAMEQEAEDKRTEAEKLANMTELQKAQYEARQLKAANEALEAERDFSKQMAIARRELASAGISMPDELLEMFVDTEADKTSAALDIIKELWPEAVNEAVKRELKRTPPPAEKGQQQQSYGASYAQEYSKKMNGGN